MILKEEHSMTALTSVPAGDDFERQLAAADPDMLRLMVKSFAEALMSAEADAACGPEYRQVSPGSDRRAPRASHLQQDPDLSRAEAARAVSTLNFDDPQ
jgi:transposase-like protein